MGWAKIGDEGIAFIALCVAGWIIAGFCMGLVWYREVRIRRNLRIVLFGFGGQNEIRVINPRQKQNDSDYLEGSLHYLSYGVYFFAVTYIISSLLRLVTVHDSTSCYIRAVVGFECYSMHKIFVLLFQTRRYQLCFKGTTNIMKCFYIGMYVATSLQTINVLTVPYFFFNQIIWKDIYCYYYTDPSTLFLLLAAAPWYFVDLTQLVVFCVKVCKMSRVINKSSKNNKNNKNIEANNMVNKKLFYILKRIVILSLCMEASTFLTVMFYTGETGEILGGFSSFIIAVDVFINVAAISLMFQHNTKSYERILFLFQCKWYQALTNKPSADVDPISQKSKTSSLKSPSKSSKSGKNSKNSSKNNSSNKENGNGNEEEEEDEIEFEMKSVMTMEPTKTAFGVEPSKRFASELSHDDTRIDDPF